MTGKIGIKISGGRYAQLLRLDGPSQGDLDLVPIDPYQSRALLTIALSQTARSVTIGEIDLNLDHVGDHIQVHCEYDGHHLLALTVCAGERTRQSKTVDLVPYTSRRAWMWIVAALVLVASLIVVWAAVLRPRSLTTRSVPPQVPTAAQFSGSSQSPADSQSPAAARREAADGRTGYTTPMAAPAAAASVNVPSVNVPSVNVPSVNVPSAEVRSADLPTVSGRGTDIDWSGETVYFDAELSILTPETRQELLAALPVLQDSAGIRVVIYGHAAPHGTAASQFALSLERATAVRDFLYQYGWTPALDPMVEGFGSEHATSRDPEYYHANRRVVIMFQSKE